MKVITCSFQHFRLTFFELDCRRFSSGRNHSRSGRNHSRSGRNDVGETRSGRNSPKPCILSATRRCYIHGDGNVNRAEKGISLFAIQHSSSFTTLDWHFLSCDFRLQIVLALYYSLTKRRINGNTFVKHHRERLFTHGRLYRLATR